MARSLLATLLAACFSSVTAGVAPEGLTVAAAADLQTVMPALAAQFQKATGHALKVTFGSSGNFFSQIQNGAPFDLFFSADIDYPRRLEAAGLVEPGSAVTYGTGRIVVWSRKDSRTDLTRGLQSLADPGVRRVALANPEHAPYGRAAVAALQHERLYERVRTKFILGENVSQAAQFADSGNADAGIIPLSLALAPALKQSGAFYEIPVTFYPPLEQAAVIIKASAHKALAREFLAFLRTPDAVRQMQAFGFALPPGGRVP
jgi:molybdate transport system substrate-binding protein